MEEFDLTGKIAIVTGAGRGLGKVFALTLAKAGAGVVIAEIDESTSKQTAREVERLGQRALSVKTDVTKRNHVKRMVAATVGEFGKVDILVNNAGICRHSPALEMSQKDWQEVIDVNMTGVFWCCQAAGEQMKKRGGGKIINISSMSALVVNKPQPQASYNASKAGVIMLTKSLAAEFAPYGISVNAIAPGYMRTEMSAKLLRQKKYREPWLSNTPMGRVGEPKELAGALLFLASEASSFVTGHILVVDGGYTCW